MKRLRLVLVRVIAGILVVAMLPGLLMLQQTGVSREALQDENCSVRLAAQQLLQNDAYANSSRIRRMSEFARNLLKGKREFEDYALAMEIAVAQGRYEEAVAFQEKALKVFSGSEEEAAEQYLRLGYLYVLIGEYEKSLNWLTLGIAVKPLVEAVLTRAQVRLNLGNAEGAVADLDACCEAVGDSSALLREMAGIYEAAGAYEKALALWQILAQDGDLLDRAYCYMQLGRMAEAEEAVERYLAQSDADGATANTMLALGYLRSGAYDRAEEFFTRALKGDGTDPASLYYYVVLSAYLSTRYERAVEYGERLIERLERGEENGATQISVEDTTGRLQVELVPVDTARLCRMVGSSCLRWGATRAPLMC